MRILGRSKGHVGCHARSRSGGATTSRRDLPEWVQAGKRTKAQKAPRRQDVASVNAPEERTAAEPLPAVPLSQQIQYERQGHVVLRSLVPRDVLDAVIPQARAAMQAGKLQALKQRVRVLCPDIDARAVRTIAEARQALTCSANDELGFLQLFNSHRTSDAIWDLVSSPVLAGAAAELMGCDNVRLYQDCLFEKEAGMGATNWHSDLRMTPLDTNSFITLWIPLRDIAAKGDSGLDFASGSHRDFSLAFWHEMEALNLDARGYRVRSTGAMRTGDVSCHHGWTLHAAPKQKSGSAPRLALAVSYFADGARTHNWESDKSLRPEMKNTEDLESYQAWLPSIRPGAPARHRDVPIVYRRDKVAPEVT